MPWHVLWSRWYILWELFGEKCTNFGSNSKNGRVTKEFPEEEEEEEEEGGGGGGEGCGSSCVCLDVGCFDKLDGLGPDAHYVGMGLSPNETSGPWGSNAKVIQVVPDSTPHAITLKCRVSYGDHILPCLPLIVRVNLLHLVSNGRSLGFAEELKHIILLHLPELLGVIVHLLLA